jgi:hypothetical protein
MIERPRIFVSIAAYRDPELQLTIRSLFRQASRPDCLSVGVCWQGAQAGEDEDAQCFLHDLSDVRDRIKVLSMKAADARGPCYARALILKHLALDEDFILQIDSHFRFVEGWDDVLLEEHSAALAESPFPVLSTYPSAYTISEQDYTRGLEGDSAKLGDATPVVLGWTGFGDDGMWRLAGKAVKHWPGSKNRPAASLFWAAGFSFCATALVRRLSAPYLSSPFLFFGEEMVMGAALWMAHRSFTLYTLLNR